MKVRESNFELLRILCMLGVLVCHVLGHCYPTLHTGDFSWQNILRIQLMNVSVVAVNCFVMISGYFRIKQSLKSFLNLYIQLLFYCGIISIVGVLLGRETVMSGAIRTIFPFSKGEMWFMVTYLGLFLLSPLLNTSFNTFDKKQRIVALISLFLIDVYLGYMHQSKEITQDGYHLVHFITIYYIGMYLSDIKENSQIRWGWLWVCCVAIMTLLHSVKMVFPPIAIIYSMRYNSPMLMVSSVLLFQWVRTWKIQSKFINWVAVSVLSVYVIHSQPVVSHYLFSFLNNICNNPSYSQLLTAGLMILVTIIFFILCILFDKLRIAFLYRSVTLIEIKLSSYVETIKRKLGFMITNE